jgi:hypothetical protein
MLHVQIDGRPWHAFERVLVGVIAFSLHAGCSRRPSPTTDVSASAASASTSASTTASATASATASSTASAETIVHTTPSAAATDATIAAASASAPPPLLPTLPSYAKALSDSKDDPKLPRLSYAECGAPLTSDLAVGCTAQGRATALYVVRDGVVVGITINPHGAKNPALATCLSSRIAALSFRKGTRSTSCARLVDVSAGATTTVVRDVSAADPPAIVNNAPWCPRYVSCVL